jgi:hypothetical protein
MKKYSLLIILILSPSLCFSQTEMVRSEALSRVYMIKYNKNIGSSFTLDIENKQYLITAKHTLSNIKRIDVIEIFHAKMWKKLKVQRIDLENPKIDIIVLAPGIQLSPATKFVPSIDGLFLSQNLFFLGFPFGMRMDSGEINNLFPFPFVRKGILSAMSFVNTEEKVLWVDGFNNKGFSGGPILYFDRKTNETKVVGVVSSFKEELLEVSFSKDISTALKAVSNAGLMMGYAITHAVEAINKNPIGVKIKSADSN